jgi:hypothetical protein
MDEFGENPSIYVWPKGHVEGTAYPENFWDLVQQGLDSVGIKWETV